MNIKPIHNDDDLTQAFKRLEQIFQTQDGTPEFDELKILVTLQQKELEPYLGVASKVPEALNRKRNLSLNMIKKLHHGLNIPYESLIH